MSFEFNVTLDRADCHIRATRAAPLPEEQPAERPHKHYSMEFHCIFSGQEVITLPLEDRTILLETGNILLLPQGIYHGVAHSGKAVERVCFNFSAEPAGKIASPIVDLFLNIDKPMLFSGEQTALLLEQCRQLWAQAEEPLQQLRLGMQFANIALNLMSQVADIPAKTPPADSLALRQRWLIEDHISQHFTDNAGLEGLAKALYLSPRQTSTLVKRFMGEDYKTVIIRRRMELAEIYLQDPNKRLDAIAYEVGYRSYSGFELCFKRYFGMTPQQKRAQLQERRL